METLIVNKAKKEDLLLLLNVARKMGIEILIAPKKASKPNKKKLEELAKTMKKSATKKAFDKMGLDYDSYSR